MQGSVRDQMLAKAAFVFALEKHVDQLAPSIGRLRDEGDNGRADAMADAVRWHRVRAMQARAELVALAGLSRKTVEPND